MIECEPSPPKISDECDVNALLYFGNEGKRRRNVFNYYCFVESPVVGFVNCQILQKKIDKCLDLATVQQAFYKSV